MFGWLKKVTKIITIIKVVVDGVVYVIEAVKKAASKKKDETK